MSVNKEKRRLKIRKSIRSKISGTKERPRISIFKSNKGVYAQIIDDTSGNTMVSCSSVEIKKFGKKKYLLQAILKILLYRANLYIKIL